MQKHIPAVVLLLLLLASSVTQGQLEKPPIAETLSVALVHIVSSDVLISAQHTQIVLPVCGEREGGSEALCSVSTHFEVLTPNGWKRVRQRNLQRIIGGVPLDRLKTQIIPSGESRTFFVAFSKDVFAIETGQKMRVAIDVWPSVESMRSGSVPIRITTKSFACP